MECRWLMGCHGSHFSCSLFGLPQRANKLPAASRHLSGIQPLTRRLCSIFIDLKESAQGGDKKKGGKEGSSRPTLTRASKDSVRRLLSRGQLARTPAVCERLASSARAANGSRAAATVTHPAIIGPDKGAHHQHGPDKHYSQMTAYRSVLATV